VVVADLSVADAVDDGCHCQLFCVALLCLLACRQIASLAGNNDYSIDRCR